MARKFSERPSSGALYGGDIVGVSRVGDALPDRKATIADISAYDGVFNVKKYAVGTTPVGDGTSRPLSTLFADLAAAQAVYPHATALTNEHDWVAIQAAIVAADQAGGGTVLIPPGLFIMTNATDAAAGTKSGTLYIPKCMVTSNKTGDGNIVITSAKLGSQVNIAGSGKHVTTLRWAYDLGWERFAMLCADSYTNGVMGVADRQMDRVVACYDGWCSDMTLAGPAFSPATNQLTALTIRCRPAALMSGFGVGSYRYASNMRVAGFYAGVDFVGGQYAFYDVRADSNFYGWYSPDQNVDLYGNLYFSKCLGNNSKGAAWAFAAGGAIGGSLFSQCYAGEAPYGILKEHAPLLLPWKALKEFRTGYYCQNSEGNIYLCTAPDTAGNTGSTGPSGTGAQSADGAVSWQYVAATTWASGNTYAQGSVVKRNGNYYVQLMANPAEASGVNGVGPVGRNAVIVDGTSATAPHIWRWLGYQAWKASTAYALGDVVATWTQKQYTPGGSGTTEQVAWYRCVKAGTSAASGGPVIGKSNTWYSTRVGIVDNTAEWCYLGTYTMTWLSQNIHDNTQFEYVALGAIYDDNATVGHNYDDWAWIGHEYHNNCQFSWSANYSQVYTTFRTRHAQIVCGQIVELRIHNAASSSTLMKPGNASGANILTKSSTTVYDNASLFLVRLLSGAGIYMEGNVEEIFKLISPEIKSQTSDTALTPTYLLNPNLTWQGAGYLFRFNHYNNMSGGACKAYLAVAPQDVCEMRFRSQSAAYNVIKTPATGATNMPVAGVAVTGGNAGNVIAIATAGQNVKVRVNQASIFGGMFLKKDTNGATYSVAGGAHATANPQDPFVFGFAEFAMLGTAYWCSTAGTTVDQNTSYTGPNATSGTIKEPTLTNQVAWKPATAWAPSTSGIAVNELRTYQGNLYQATAITTGTTGTTGPTGTGSGIVDGGVTWAYRSTIQPWTHQMAAALPAANSSTTAYCYTPDGNVYVCSQAGTTTAAVGLAWPTGTGTGIVDNTAKWDYVGTNTWLTPWAPGVGKSLGNIIYSGAYAVARLIGLS